VAWHEALEDERDRDEAAIIVDAFAARHIDIGGVAATHGGIAFMYAKDRILARQQHLGGVGGRRGTQSIDTAGPQRGYWTYSGSTMSAMSRSGRSPGGSSPSTWILTVTAAAARPPTVRSVTRSSWSGASKRNSASASRRLITS
jgi:hypothetical protein